MGYEIRIGLVTSLTEEDRKQMAHLVRNHVLGPALINWCQLIAKSALENVSIYHALVYQENKLLAVSIFYIVRSLDATRYLKGKTVRFLTALRRVGIRLLDFDVLFFEIPLQNFGSFVFSNETNAIEQGKIVKAVTELVEETYSVHAVFVKLEPDSISPARLLPETYSKLSTLPPLPNALLRLSYGSFGEYLESLPRKVRWDVKDKMRKFGAAKGKIEIYHDTAPIADELYKLFRNTSAPLQGRDLSLPITLSKSFFENLVSLQPENGLVLVAKVDNQVVGFLVIFRYLDTLFYKQCGLDYDLSRKSMAYFNLLYEGIKYAIANNCRQIHLGATSYFAKQKLGCQLIPTDTYLKIMSTPIQMLSPFVRLS